jgi:hypothetical protein
MLKPVTGTVHSEKAELRDFQTSNETVNFNMYQETKLRGGFEERLYPFFNIGSIWGWAVSARPLPLSRRILSRGEWASGRSGGVRKISPLLGCELRTIQTVASCYTDYAMPNSQTPNIGFS